MRNFHTQSNGLPEVVDLQPIGRKQVHPPDKPNFSNDPLVEVPLKTFFSERNKWNRMQQNISLALNFTRKQKSNLHEVLNVLELWKGEVSRIGNRQSNIFSLFTDPLIRLSNDKYCNHPLFDDGSTQPLKIHFNLNGKRDFIEIPILPLKSQPNFMSLLGGPTVSSSVPSLSLFESSSSEAMQLLLSLGKTIDLINAKSLNVRRGNRDGASLRGNVSRGEPSTLLDRLYGIMESLGFTHGRGKSIATGNVS